MQDKTNRDHSPAIFMAPDRQVLVIGFRQPGWDHVQGFMHAPQAMADYMAFGRLQQAVQLDAPIKFQNAFGTTALMGPTAADQVHALPTVAGRGIVRIVYRDGTTAFGQLLVIEHRAASSPRPGANDPRTGETARWPADPVIDERRLTSLELLQAIANQAREALRRLPPVV